MLPWGFEPQLPGRKPGVFAIYTKEAIEFKMGDIRESNPFLKLHKLACIHYNNAAIKRSSRDSNPNHQVDNLAC